MCYNSDHIALCETSHGQITWCRICKTYSVVYQSCCASFTPPEMRQFRSLLLELEDRDFMFDMLNEPYTIIKNQFGHIGFCINRKDAELLIDLIQQAFTVHEFYKILE